MTYEKEVMKIPYHHQGCNTTHGSAHHVHNAYIVHECACMLWMHVQDVKNNREARSISEVGECLAIS